MAKIDSSGPSVWALGPLPPPVTGMTVLTQKVVEGLRRRTLVTVASWSAGDDRPRPHTRVLRVLRTAGCLARLVLHGRAKNGRLYLTCNSRGGLAMTGLLIKAARRMGYKVYLHHHVYMYIEERAAKMAWIAKNMGPNDVHLMHCEQMIDDFRACYDSPAQYEFLYPSFASLPLGEVRRNVRDPFRLGFLANLTIAKGLDIVLDTFRALRAKNRNVHLTLAGPIASPEAERLVANAPQEFGDRVCHMGPIYDERKLEFFNSVDCFVFPSRTEGWPIVLNEALDAGLPVVVTNRGCVSTMVGDRAGLVVQNPDRYVEEAVHQIEAWIDDHDSYRTASQAAIEQAAYLHREADRQLDEFANRICAATPPQTEAQPADRSKRLFTSS